MTRLFTKSVKACQNLLFLSSLCVPAAAFATQIHVVDPTGKHAAGIVVYANVSPTPPSTVRTAPVMITQQEKMFTPPLVVSQKGQEVTFANKDDITHHIYSVGEQNAFSFKIRAGVDDKKHTFSHSGQVSMGCNIHDWMSGYLYVVDTPYFGISDSNGNVTLDLPSANAITLMVWHPNLAKGVAQEFVLADLNASAVEIALKGTYSPLEIDKPQTDFDFLDDYE